MLTHRTFRQAPVLKCDNVRRMDVRGAVAVIAGASGAIGSETARAFARAGARLVLAALPDEALPRLASELSQAGSEAVAVPLDITRRGDVDRLIASTLERFGRIDVLANIVGVGSSPSLSDCTDEELERVISVNLLGAARLIHAVLPVMKAQGRGAIVSVGSVAGEAGVMGIYSASKFGLRGLSDSVRREVRADGISVSLIEPGFVESPMNPALKGKLPSPKIVADAIVHAVKRPRRARIVPASYGVPIFIAKAFPALFDFVFGDARIQKRLNRDSREQRQSSSPDGTSERR
jgi:NAD(P)-dependent dehydrogenase (short-subunit alcohol dehydrogenase family)